MNIDLPPDQQEAIEGLAAQNGASPEAQVRQMIADALMRAEDYDRWFRDQVREGRAAALRGELMEHDEVGRILEQRYRG